MNHSTNPKVALKLQHTFIALENCLRIETNSVNIKRFKVSDRRATSPRRVRAEGVAVDENAFVRH